MSENNTLGIDKIKIGGHLVDIVYDQQLTRKHDAIGRSDCCTNTINIDNTYPLAVQTSTLIHEIIEQLNYHLELGLEHSTITQLEYGLYQVLKDNKMCFGVEEQL